MTFTIALQIYEISWKLAIISQIKVIFALNFLIYEN